MKTFNIFAKLSADNKILIIDVQNSLEKIYHLSETAASGNITPILYKSVIDYNFENNQELHNFLTDNTLRINGTAIQQQTVSPAYTITTSSSVQIQHLYTISLDNFNNPVNGYFSLHFKCTVKDGTADKDYIFIAKVYVDAVANNQYKFYQKQSHMIQSNMESFMLLRTNPKLTGNIKLVVTSDNNMYIDTFKVSSTAVLNQKAYRKKAVSIDGNYPHDVYNVFHNLPQGELYNVYPDSYKPHKNYFNIDQQIENIYEYGAEFNNDNLYSENMKILAPLYIGKHLPTYFAIFRTSRMTTADSTQPSVEIFKDMIKESTMVKAYDLRKSTTVGNYLNSYAAMVQEYIAGSCSLQFIEQDTDVESKSYRQGRNTWKGISVSKGILTTMTETSYFATQILNKDHQVQEQFDMFLLNGYSRNNLLYPNILNLEFMFNDEEAEDFKMYNYFGLYLTENEFITFNQIIEDSDINGSLTYFDENNEEILLTNTKANIIEEYPDRIFFMTTNKDMTYVKHIDDINKFSKLHVINKPDKNILQMHGSELAFNESDKSFITLEFTGNVSLGEHFKFVIINNSYNGTKRNLVFELIASNDKRLLNMDNQVSPYMQTNQYDGKINVPTFVYTTTFYAMDDEGTDVADTATVIKRMVACIAKFKDMLYVSDYDDDTISVVSYAQHTYFQHILNDINVNDTPEKQDYIRCFNYNNVVYCKPLSQSVNDYIDNLPFAPLGLDKLGNRLSSIVKFIDVSDYENYIVYEIDKDIYDDVKKFNAPMISSVNGYLPVIKHKIYEGYINSDLKLTGNDDVYACVINPYNNSHSIIISKYKSNLPNGMINLCSPLASNISIMGIAKVRDIDMYVDSPETYEYKTGDTATFQSGEIVYFDNSDARLRMYTTYYMVSGAIKNIPASPNSAFFIAYDGIYYSDGSNTYTECIAIDEPYIEFIQDTTIQLVSSEMMDKYEYAVNKPVLNSLNYYIDPQNIETSELMMPFVPMINCQWKSNGTYMDNNPVIDVKNFKDYDVNGNFIENLYSPGADTGQYVINNINDHVNYSDDETMTIKDIMLNSKYSNMMKKYLISKYKIQTAIGYYNPKIQTLTFVCYGMAFNISMSNVQYKSEIQLNQYQNFEVFIINNYTDVTYNEFFINKKDEFILIINHTYNINNNYNTNNIKYLTQDGNLFKQTRDFITCFYGGTYNNGTVTIPVKGNYSQSGFYISFSKVSGFLELGKTYSNITISADIKGTGSIKIGYEYNGQTKTIPISSSAEYTRYSITLSNMQVHPAGYSGITAFIFYRQYNITTGDNQPMYIKNWMMTIGNETEFFNTDLIKLKNISDEDYTWYDAPYNYNIIDTAILNNTVFLSKSDSRIIDQNTANNMIEIDTPVFGTDKPVYSYFQLSDNFSSLPAYDSLGKENVESSEIYQFVCSKNTGNEATHNIGNNFNDIYSMNNIDYRDKHTYMLKYSKYKDSITAAKDKMDVYKQSFMNNAIKIYIINSGQSAGNNYNIIDINNDYQPITLNVTSPNKIKYNYGLFDINFVDIFDFEISDKISDELDLDTLYANTYIKDIKSLPNYYYNKIMDDGAVCTFNYFSESTRNLFATCWDNNIYRLYSNDKDYTRIKGYATGICDKMFFGSICLNIKNDGIILDKWDYTADDNFYEISTSDTNENSNPKNKYNIVLNLTKTFYKTLLNNETFRSNWNNAKDILNMTVYINNFITNTLTNIYSLISGFDVDVYRKYDPTIAITSTDLFMKDKPADIENYKVIKNISTKFEEINNEVILTISISDYEGYKYYPTVKILKK